MTILVNFITMFAFYCVGFMAGYFSQKPRIEEAVKKAIDKIKQQDVKVGVLHRPTASELYKKTDPYERKLKEGADAMSDTLKNIKELK